MAVILCKLADSKAVGVNAIRIAREYKTKNPFQRSVLPMKMGL